MFVTLKGNNIHELIALGRCHDKKVESVYRDGEWRLTYNEDRRVVVVCNDFGAADDEFGITVTYECADVFFVQDNDVKGEWEITPHNTLLLWASDASTLLDYDEIVTNARKAGFRTPDTVDDLIARMKVGNVNDMFTGAECKRVVEHLGRGD